MKITPLIISVILIALAGTGQATLTTIGTASYNGGTYKLIWDNDSPSGSLIWFDYTSPDNTYQNQVDWVNNLNTVGTISYATDSKYRLTWINSWRLTSNESEMHHIYYTELGNVPEVWPLYMGPYEHIYESPFYWLSDPPPFEGAATYYLPHDDYSMRSDNDYFTAGALAVRPGIVSSPVPEPSTILILGAGLGGLAMWHRRKGHKHD